MSDPTAPHVDERWPRGRRSLAFDVVLALLATGLELILVADTGGPAVVLVAVAGGVLVLRRSAPLPVLATTLAAMAAFVALDGGPRA